MFRSFYNVKDKQKTAKTELKIMQRRYWRDSGGSHEKPVDMNMVELKILKAMTSCAQAMNIVFKDSRSLIATNIYPLDNNFHHLTLYI